jgi:hypothetical protein
MRELRISALSVAAPSLEAGLVHQVKIDLPEREFRVVRHGERHRSKAVEVLLSMVRPREHAAG